MERKKLLRTVVAALCIVSMVFGYFVEIMPALKAQAAETETLPTDFNEVTPREFGVADFSGNTEKAVYKSSLKPLASADKMLFRANVVFNQGRGITIFDKNATDSTGAGLYLGMNSWATNSLRFSSSYARVYVGGRFEDGSFVDGVSSEYYYDFKPLGGETCTTTEIPIALTMEVVNFDGGESANDLKIGIWIDGSLNTYVHCRDFVPANNHMFLSANVQSLTSPAITAKSQWDGYRIVTPATFGIGDFSGNTGEEEKTSSVKPLDSADKMLFRANVVFGSGTMTLFDSTATDSSGHGLGFWAQGSTKIRFNCQFAKIYREDGTLETSTSSAGYIYDMAPSSLANGTAKTAEISLAITTEVVNFDGGTNANDLKVGIWFDGVLYNNAHLYMKNFVFETENMFTRASVDSLISPQVTPDDLGLVSGEYGASEGAVIGASEVATSKVMDGTTLETDIMFNGVGASLLYGCDATDTAKAFKLTSTEDGIKVSHTYNGEEEQLGVLTKDLLGVDLVNNKFHLKLTTDGVNIDGGETADDVLLGIQVNDKKLGYFAANVASQLTGRTGVESTGNASVIIGSFASDKVNEIQHCLDESNYTISAADGISRLSVNGTVVTDDTITLDKPGAYSIVSTKNRLIHKEEVVLYNRYDVNEDNTVDVKDLVRMLKVADATTQDAEIAKLGKAGKLAIAYEGADKWTSDNAIHVKDFMREKLAGTQAEVKQTGAVTVIDRKDLDQFANKHGAFTGNFTFTLDLTDIERLEQIWILSTKAKYISVDGSYPTIRFKILKASGSQLYISHKYKVGEKNTYVERQWRVPETLGTYTKLEVNFVVPDGVALYLNEIKDMDNVVGEVSTEDETVYAADNNVKYLAHSGFLQYAPDNTLLSFEMAGKMGFKSLITIPKFTADGVGVCLHDDEIYKTLRNSDGSSISDTTLKIQDLTYEQLADYDAGIRKGEAFRSPVPTLEQYFDICMKYRMAPVFSTHPELTVENCQYIYNMLHLDKYKDENGNYWLYERLQIKAGGSRIGIDDPLSVFGFDIGGYIFIQPSSFGNNDLQYVFTNTQLEEKAQELGINVFDKVSVEFFDYSDDKEGDTVEDKIAFAKSFGFKRISLAPNGNAAEAGFSSEKQRYYMNLGVNSFTVDYHCSMGLNW